jgi:hypothetical protein
LAQAEFFARGLASIESAKRTGQCKCDGSGEQIDGTLDKARAQGHRTLALCGINEKMTFIEHDPSIDRGELEDRSAKSPKLPQRCAAPSVLIASIWRYEDDGVCESTRAIWRSMVVSSRACRHGASRAGDFAADGKSEWIVTC